MSDNLSQEYADSIADDLRETVGNGRVFDALEYLDDCLDMRRTYAFDNSLVSVEVAVTLGGPNCWVTFQDSGATVNVNWGGDKAEVYVYAPFAVESVLEFVGECMSVA